MKNNTILRIILVTGLFLLIPLYGNRFIEGWNWSPFDFVFATVMVGGVQLAYAYISKKAGSSAYKIATGLTLLGMFLLIWINGAVGIIGDEDNGWNAMYFAVIGTIFLGSLISQFKSTGMKRTLYVASCVQMIVPVIAFVAARAEIAKTPGVLGVFMLNAVFAMIFASAGVLYAQASEISR